MGTTSGTSWHESNRGMSLYISADLFLFILCIGLGKLVHDNPRLGSFLPEAGMVILLGILFGSIVLSLGGENENGLAQSVLSFSPTVFFVVLLPPIIFNSGYHVRRDLFFRYITPICLYALLGTAICAVFVAGLLYLCRSWLSFQPTFLELLAFGALISATDPVSTLAIFSSKQVDPHLFYLVFGESCLNDAVGLVLFTAVAHLIENDLEGLQISVRQETIQFLFDFVVVFVGSMFLGWLFGLICAFVLKHCDLRPTPLLELSFVVTLMYFPFVVAEIFHLSGIVAVLFAGFSAKRYVEPNLSDDSKRNADTIFRLAAHVTETLVFLDLGLSVPTLASQGAFHFGFICLALSACLMGRAVNIYPITGIYNFAVRNSPMDDAQVPSRTAHMLWFSGLRGAVSYGLAKTFPASPNQDSFVMATMVIVLLTTFVLGGSTEAMLAYLRVPVGVDEKEYLETLDKKKLLPGPLRRFENQRIRTWVARPSQLDEDGIQMGDYYLDDDNKAPDKPNIANLKATDDHYEEHFEITEREHYRRVKKRNGVFDYGHW